MNAATLRRPSLLAAMIGLGAVGFIWHGRAQTIESDEWIEGKLRWEVYEGIAGVELTALKAHPGFPDNPDFVGWVSEFAIPEQWGDNFGARLSGFLIPPISGSYVFSIASDDQGELYLSSDGNPANKVLIASEPMWSPPGMWVGRDAVESAAKRSDPVFLQAGQPYYVEALLKEAGGGDHLGVTWQLPGHPPTENGAPPIPSEHLASWMSGQPPAPAPELHVVGIYSGRTPEGGASRDHEPGEATVLVDRPGQAVTLFLSAYEPVRWHVIATADTQVERVFLDGYYEPTVTGLGPDVEVHSRSYQAGPSAYLWIGCKVDSSRFHRSVPKIRERTGLEICSFHGAYTAPHPDPFVIDGVQEDPRLRSDYPQPLPPEMVPRVGFQMAFYREGAPEEVGSIFIRDCLLAGPQDNGGLLPAERMTMDAYRPFYYGAAHHRLWSVHGPSSATEELDPGPDLPELSWVMGTAFDRERNRVLVVSLGGQGYLYAFSPPTGQWSLLASMDGRDLDCLEYHDRDDSLYGVTTSHMDAVKPVILRFSPTGTPRGEIALPVFPFDIGPGGYRSELVSVGDYLALLLEPDPRYLENQDIREGRIYLVAPDSGEVQLTYRRKGLAKNQPPSVRITSPREWDTFAQGESIMVKAAVDDPDGEVTVVEILANGPRVGRAQQIPGTDLFQLSWPGTLTGDVHLVADAVDNGGARSMSVPLWIRIAPTPPALVHRHFTDLDPETGRVRVELHLAPEASMEAIAVEDRPPPGWTAIRVSHDGVYDPLTTRVKYGPFFDHQPRVLTYTAQAPLNATGTFRFVGRGSADGVNYPIGGEQEITLAGYHPADRSPRDWQLVIEEVTAYGAAWRRGQAWPVPPNPIPMDYVTWAGALWRLGEGYGFEPLIPDPPHWWVIDPDRHLSEAAGIGPHGSEPRSDAVRALPANWTAGDPCPVSLTITPTPGTRAYAVEEQLPEGCTPSEIAWGGVFDPEQRTLRWGPFLDSQERRIHYELELTNPGPSPLGFSGQVSLDGASRPITGSSSLPAGSTLDIRLGTTAPNLRLRFTGQPGTPVVLETSSDLQHWQPVADRVETGHTLSIDSEPRDTGPARFYRLRTP